MTKEQEEQKDHTFGKADICKATLPNGDEFECHLNRKMRGWGFPTWEVRITKGGSRGCLTHVTEGQLELLEAYDRNKAMSTSRFGR